MMTNPLDAGCEVARDAARYRWLVAAWSAPFPLSPQMDAVLAAFRAGDKTVIDAAIDAAIAALGAGRGGRE